MRLITLNLFFPHLPRPVRLVFKSEERAKQELHRQPDPTGAIIFSDEFGTEIHAASLPTARVLTDVVEEINADIEFSLLQARAQLKAQQKAQSDPTLSNHGRGKIWTPPNGGGPVLPFPQR